MKGGRFDRRGVIAAGGAVVLLLLAVSAFDFLREEQRLTGAREAEAARILGMADEFTRLERANAGLRETMKGGEPVMRTVERIAAAEGLTIASTSTAGGEALGPWRESLTSVRIAGAALTPLKRALTAIESSRSAVIIRELTLRRSIDRARRLDVEIVIGLLDIEAEEAR